ncbi:hypothetical protein GCM10020255_020690 [Rhodococcus baikonurensis]
MSHDDVCEFMADDVLAVFAFGVMSDVDHVPSFGGYPEPGDLTVKIDRKILDDDQAVDAKPELGDERFD